MDTPLQSSYPRYEISPLQLLRLGRLDEAWQAAEKEIETSQPEVDRERFCRLSFVLAEVLRNRGKAEEALHLLNSIPGKVPLTMECQAELAMHRGYCKAVIGNYSAAHALLREAEDFALRTGRFELHGEIKIRQAMVAYLEEDFLTSGELYKFVVDKYGDQFGWYLHCIALCGVGKGLMARRCFEEAIPWFNRGVEISESVGATLLVAKHWSELGVCYLGLNQVEKALQVHFDAQNILLAAGAMHAYQVNLADIGNVYLQKQEYLTAISYYRRALELAKQMKAAASVEKWSYNLRLAYHRLQKFIDNSAGSQ